MTIDRPSRRPGIDDQGLMQLARAQGTSSFTDFLAQVAPQMLPSAPAPNLELPHATTIVAAQFADGVVMAGDRRATMGNLIAQRDIEKVYPADDYSLVAFAGVAGLGMEMVRLFQLELEHFEKIEGTELTLAGKANRLATMIRGNLGMALQGLTVVPLFAGYDVEIEEPSAAARIYSYDPTGSCSSERYFHSVGSGSLFARGALKKLWRENMSRDEIVRVVVESLYDAADDDSATGGPDVTRRIYPVVMTATVEGTSRVGEEELDTVVRAILADREARPGA